MSKAIETAATAVVDNAEELVETAVEVTEDALETVEEHSNTIAKVGVIGLAVVATAGLGFLGWKALKKRAAKKILAEIDEIVEQDEDTEVETEQPAAKPTKRRRAAQVVEKVADAVDDNS